MRFLFLLLALLPLNAHALEEKDLPTGQKSVIWRACRYDYDKGFNKLDCDCYQRHVTKGLSVPALAMGIVEAQERVGERIFGSDKQNMPINKQAQTMLTREIAVYAAQNKSDVKTLRKANYMAAGDELDAKVKQAEQACRRQTIDLGPF